MKPTMHELDFMRELCETSLKVHALYKAGEITLDECEILVMGVDALQDKVFTHKAAVNG